MDTVQLVLLSVIVVLTILLIILGIQVFFILSEFRRTIMKANHILDNADSITQNIQTPISAIAALATGIKASSLITVAKFIKTLLSRDKENEDHRKHNKEE